MKSWSVAYVFNTGRLPRLEAAYRGDVPREFFFGALELEGRGHRVGYLETDAEYRSGRVGFLFDRMLARGWLPEKMSAGLISQVYRLLPALNRHDCVVGTTSGIGFALSLFCRIGLLHKPIVVIHCGLLNNPYNSFRRWATALLLKQSHTILYGDGECDPLCTLCPGIDDAVSVNQFGVDIEFWSPDPKGRREDFVLSVGNDGRRDYDTLVRAAGLLDCPVRIVTSRQMPAVLPTNVTVVKGSWHRETLSDADLRSLYRRAGCVVIPLVESFQPSGQSVALQAMACGCPVILTRTAGLWNDQMMRDHENVLFVPPGDAETLACSIRALMRGEVDGRELGRKGCETVRNKASLDLFARQMESVLQRLVEGKNAARNIESEN